MSHPLLVKVLGDAYHVLDGSECATEKLGRPCGVGQSRAACIPDHIAAHIEAGLAQCRDCGWPPDGDRHTNPYHRDHHAYVPRVTP